MKKVFLFIVILIFCGFGSDISAFDTCEPYHRGDHEYVNVPCSYNGVDYDSAAVEAYVNTFFFKGINYVLYSGGYYGLVSQYDTCDGLLMAYWGTVECSHSFTFATSSALFYGVGASYTPAACLDIKTTIDYSSISLPYSWNGNIYDNVTILLRPNLVWEVTFFHGSITNATRVNATNIFVNTDGFVMYTTYDLANIGSPYMSGNGNIYVTSPYTIDNTNYVASFAVQDDYLSTCYNANFSSQSRFSLDLPVNYWSTSNFYTASLGSNSSGGRVNSWFDHKSPTYHSDLDPKLYRYDGCERFNANIVSCISGDGCYNGHNGIDFSNKIVNGQHFNQQIYPAASGKVYGTPVRNCKRITPDFIDRPCGDKYGNHVWIGHQNGYATLYAHLDQDSIPPDTIDTGKTVEPRTTILGIMGNTGYTSGSKNEPFKGIHLHFGVYYNPNYFNPNFTGWIPTDVVDPYGCFGSWCNNDHPWNASGGWLWKYPPVFSSTLGVSGGTMSSNTGSVNISIPQGAVSEPTLFELLDIPTFSEPTFNYRSVGRSFWLRQGQSLLNMTSRGVTKNLGGFAKPITIEISYTDESILHINESQLVINCYDEITGSWISLPTVVDTNLNKATAQTTLIGRFDLQGVPLCPGDTQEPNDSYNAALTISVNSPPSVNFFDIFQDEDWVRFYSLAGSSNVIETLNLSPGVDTILELYGIDGFTLLTSNDNYGPGLASHIDWKAPYEGTYFVRVYQAPGSSFGCSSNYEIRVNQTNYIYLPLILQAN